MKSRAYQRSVATTTVGARILYSRSNGFSLIFQCKVQHRSQLGAIVFYRCPRITSLVSKAALLPWPPRGDKDEARKAKAQTRWQFSLTACIHVSLVRVCSRRHPVLCVILSGNHQRRRGLDGAECKSALLCIHKQQVFGTAVNAATSWSNLCQNHFNALLRYWPPNTNLVIASRWPAYCARPRLRGA